MYRKSNEIIVQEQFNLFALQIIIHNIFDNIFFSHKYKMTYLKQRFIYIKVVLFTLLK